MERLAKKKSNRDFVRQFKKSNSDSEFLKKTREAEKDLIEQAKREGDFEFLERVKKTKKQGGSTVWDMCLEIEGIFINRISELHPDTVELNIHKEIPKGMLLSLYTCKFKDKPPINIFTWLEFPDDNTMLIAVKEAQRFELDNESKVVTGLDSDLKAWYLTYNGRFDHEAVYGEPFKNGSALCKNKEGYYLLGISESGFYKRTSIMELKEVAEINDYGQKIGRRRVAILDDGSEMEV